MKMLKRLIKKTLSLIGLSKKLNPKSNAVIHGFKPKNGPGEYAPGMVFYKEESPTDNSLGVEFSWKKSIIFNEHQSSANYWLSGKGLAAYVQETATPLNEVKCVLFFDKNSNKKSYVKVKFCEDSYIRLACSSETAPVIELMKI